MEYPSSGHDHLALQAEPTVAELLRNPSSFDPREDSHDACLSAALELEQRLRGQGAPLTLSSDLASVLGELDSTMPAALWSLYEPEQVSAFQRLEAASGIEGILANMRTPIADLLADGAAPQLYDLGYKAVSLASRQAAPYCLGAVSLEHWDTADPVAAFTAAQRLLEGALDAGAQGLLLEQIPSLDLACNLIDALAEKHPHLPALILCFDPTAKGVSPEVTPEVDARGFALLGSSPHVQPPDHTALVAALTSRKVAAWGFSVRTAEELMQSDGLFVPEESRGAVYLVSAGLLESGAADHLIFDPATTAVGLIGPAWLSQASQLVLAQQHTGR